MEQNRSNQHDVTLIMAIFQDNPGMGKPVPECLHSASYWSGG